MYLLRHSLYTHTDTYARKDTTCTRAKFHPDLFVSLTLSAKIRYY